jgi:hypothetical protein
MMVGMTDGRPHTDHTHGPIPGSYWVLSGLLAAGPRPVADLGLREKGIDVVIDLTAPVWAGGPSREQILVLRHPIPDFDVPTEPGMRAILDDIDRALDGDRTVYVHCEAGVGRTGTVVGCWLVRHGVCSPGEVMGAIADLRTHAGLLAKRSPETIAQRRLVESWTVSA